MVEYYKIISNLSFGKSLCSYRRKIKDLLLDNEIVVDLCFCVHFLKWTLITFKNCYYIMISGLIPALDSFFMAPVLVRIRVACMDRTLKIVVI